MCGIAGFINYSPAAPELTTQILTGMTVSLAHRGPDDTGTWIDDEANVCFGHRRLSIIDLSPAGAQPMHSASGRYTIVFNGEIYGFKTLRDELEERGARFRGHSDTEVLLEAVEAYGFQDALIRLNGMFAFALYDRAARQVLFARDRVGKKPLYIGLAGQTLAFGSELKALRKHPAFSSPVLDRGAATLFARHNYIPSPYTIYRDVIKVPPGCWLAVSTDDRPDFAHGLRDRFQRYWNVFKVAEAGCADPIIDDEEAMELLEGALKTAVRERMVSDVPVGALLSGGIDSSLVVSMMQEVSSSKVRTYTVRFNEGSHNEADAAAAIAGHLGTDHSEILAEPSAVFDLIDDLPETYDEPFADPSQIPTMLVSRLVRRDVTVALSGDGGDETFGGYNRYRQMMTFDSLARKVPGFVNKAVDLAPAWVVGGALTLGGPAIPSSLREEISTDRIKKLAELMQVRDFDERYLAFLSEWSQPEKVVSGGYEPETAMTCARSLAGLRELDRMMIRDTAAYLPDDVLVKVDRASMSVGLEMRAPLLDHRVIELAWRSPRRLCIENGNGKLALRRMLKGRVPAELMDRPKRGFGIPINDWLRGPLEEWASESLSRSRLQRDGIFNPDPVRKCWKEHQSGRRNWGPKLWNILMFNAWVERWGSG
ncbi:asparagine synthase (glutamine-hydrolyzing) [Rhizobiales bacterium]|uniref:asparagine synthase (glutamine-hydrolyzing) n=1 Tax=Hongsoonwoonella zoysiae TaxID=2821844 RepID=UPI001560410C|nr:asparagine synthase (glutamine-hydrolyzing) [Hongsoonwoonella zoysiae]NRG18303.1 asparagine synthase (glutamine-hydrolyzing) [Hongsoonwoonella zoysiae]